MTLMAGPIDARLSPTAVNDLALGRPIEWFERNVIDRVPPRFAGRDRKVYPGFVQLASFVAMNPERHLTAHRRLQEHLARGEKAEAAAIEAFYDEYCAVLDMPAEFYLETLRVVFQEHHLARGRLEVRGRLVRPQAIRRTALLTVEGERDDICGFGQTMAAQDLCTGLKPYLKRHHLQLGAGHYGVFGGRKWTTQIYPLVQSMIAAAS
jgi:polyhydroxyalkanoate depolymerase